jgi:hypothetical protein
MPTPTYTPLATVTLGTAAASVTFSSIPATYRDLVLVVNGTVSSAAYARLRYNGDTGSNYLAVVMMGRGGLSPGAASGSGTYDGIYLPWNTIVASERFALNAQIMDYSATDKHKTLLSRSNATTTDYGQSVYAEAWRWANTSAITSVSVSATAGNFNTGATFNLYGVIA